jgi:hypothetical protein
MRFFRTFTPGALARPVIIVIKIGGNNYATGKHEKSHSESHQLLSHRHFLFALALPGQVVPRADNTTPFA